LSSSEWLFLYRFHPRDLALNFAHRLFAVEHDEGGAGGHSPPFQPTFENFEFGHEQAPPIIMPPPMAAKPMATPMTTQDSP
jgi:hypothetical protein